MSSDPVKRSDMLDKKLAERPDLNKSVAFLLAADKRNTMLRRWLTLSMVFDIILTFSIGYIFVQSQVNRANIVSNHNALVASCNAGNEFRQTNLVLWHYILAIPPDPPLTPSQQVTADQFRVVVDKTFASRDCKTIK